MGRGGHARRTEEPSRATRHPHTPEPTPEPTLALTHPTYPCRPSPTGLQACDGPGAASRGPGMATTAEGTSSQVSSVHQGVVQQRGEGSPRVGRGEHRAAGKVMPVGKDREEYLNAVITDMELLGNRCILVAVTDLPGLSAMLEVHEFTCIAILGIRDPIRAHAKSPGPPVHDSHIRRGVVYTSTGSPTRRSVVLCTTWSWLGESGAVQKEGEERGRREESRKPRAREPRKTEAKEFRRRGEISQAKMNS